MREIRLDQNLTRSENCVNVIVGRAFQLRESGEMRATAEKPSDDDSDDEPIVERTTAAETTRLSFSMAARHGFFQRVIDGARKSLPGELTHFHAKPGFDMVKIWYDNERIHYEAAIDLHREHIEIGLHFEDGPVSTAIYLRAFDQDIVAIKHELGAAVELGRVFELTPLTVLDAKTGEWAAHRLSAFIAELQPLVEETYAPAERSAQLRSPHTYRWGGKGRRSGS